jgi:hypothetical protein
MCGQTSRVTGTAAAPGMLGRQTIAHRQGAHSCCPTRLGHHPAMAHDGAGAIAAAVEKQQNSGSIAAANDRPFTRHSADIDGFEFHVVSRGPVGADLVEAPPPFCPPDRSWLGVQQRANGVNLALTHGFISRDKEHRPLCWESAACAKSFAADTKCPLAEDGPVTIGLDEYFLERLSLHRFLDDRH